MHICHFTVQCLDFLDHNKGSSSQHMLKRNAKSQYKKFKKKFAIFYA